MSELLDRARAWITGDPDPATRDELEELIDSGEIDQVARRMGQPLAFGTAGIRGVVGAGSSRMNRAVVIRTTYGLVRHLIESNGGAPNSPVVIGFDARPSSKQFAEDTAGVLIAAGIAVRFFPDVTPTPLVAFAAKHLGASAAVVVTASHNPPADNGYKVYGPDAAQIVSPVDQQIQEAIVASPAANQIPRVDGAFSTPNTLVDLVPDSMVDAYWDEVDRVRTRDKGSNLKIVYTPIHGVGLEVLTEVMSRSGHSGIVPVPTQARPDGTFPTVEFPNPEEEGALDLALSLASEIDADLVLANDPDADRLAVVVPDGDLWRPLSGNEIGVLLGDYILSGLDDPTRAIVASSIVSSPMLAAIAASYGATHTQTLTGFKWIAKAGMSLAADGKGEFVFGYEEALGFTVGSVVRDKDGISAAILFTDLVADLADQNQSILDRLTDLWRSHGLWVSTQVSVTKPGEEGLASIQAAVERLGNDPPATVGDTDVTAIVDYRSGAENRPFWLSDQMLIELRLGEHGRVLVRPSGTEPKLKIYVDLRSSAGPSPHTAHAKLLEKAKTLGDEVASGLEL